MKKDKAIQKLNDFIKKFGTRLDFRKRHIYFIRGKLFYFEGELPQELNLDFAGEYLGWFDKKKLFKPSIRLVQLIGKSTNKNVKLDEKKSWLFSCGRDIFGTGSNSGFRKRDFVIVENSKKEILGWAFVKNSGFDTEDVWLENKLDIGDFLRREPRSNSNKKFK